MVGGPEALEVTDRRSLYVSTCPSDVCCLRLYTKDGDG